MSDEIEVGMKIIPDDIVEVKPIFRFKCVSKRWNSFISTPHFISTYIYRSPNTPSWLILDRFNQADSPESGDLMTMLINHVTSFTISAKLLAQVISSSVGLILFGRGTDIINQSFEDGLFVANPITREWVSLPLPAQSISLDCGAVAFTVQVDSATGVVERFMVVEYCPPVGTSTAASLKYFSSETWEWNKKPISAQCVGPREDIREMERPKDCFEFDGHLYWTDLANVLVVLDDPFCCGLEETVKCCYIPLPKDITGRSSCSINSGGGYVQCVWVYRCDVDGIVAVNVWRLKDHYVSDGEWCLVHIFSLMELYDFRYSNRIMPWDRPSPCFVHPFDANIAFFEICGHLFSLQLKTGKMVSSSGRYYDPTDDESATSISVMPFVIPPRPTTLLPCCSCDAHPRVHHQGNQSFKYTQSNGGIYCCSRARNRVITE